MPTPVVGVTYTAGLSQWDSPGRLSLAGGPTVTGPKLRANGVRAVGPAVVGPLTPADWSDSNPPWAYTDTSVFTQDWPVGTTIVPLQTGGADFYTNLTNTVNAAGKRVVVQLPDGTHHLTLFRHIGSGSDPTYAVGFWHPNLQGLLGNGPDVCRVQMDANSMTTAQLDQMKTMTAAAFAPLAQAMIRFDGANASSPVLLAGVTFQAADQQMLTSVASDVPCVVPQPAPHQGVWLYTAANSQISYCRFRAAGRAMMGAPPFEMGNLTTSHGNHVISNCEFDGRLASDINPKQPRRSGPIMANNELYHEIRDCWFHHANVTRYAVNDQNSNTTGQYISTRVKFEHITDNQNVDPDLNGGVSLGGWGNTSNYGWESCNGTITITDTFSVISVAASGGPPTAFLLTTPGTNVRNPQGGRFFVVRGTFKHTVFPQLNDYVTFRIGKTTYWYTDGVATTIDVRRTDGTRLTGWEFVGTWPPTAAQLAAAGVSPSTHYIYKGV